MISNLEYRINFIVDALIQPCITTVVEIVLWMAIFRGAGTDMIGGFTREYYLAYALWATFVARISTSWLYEFRMIEEVEQGTINSLLVRPLSFYEYYLSQMLGYKFVTTIFSLWIPIVVGIYLDLPVHLDRLPIIFLLIGYYLFLVHSMSFLISTFAFYLNKVNYFTSTKNLALWLLTGELFPIDLMPEAWRDFVLSLPFVSGVYLPIGYLTGRIGFGVFIQGFQTVTLGLIIVNVMGYLLWAQGLKKYSGTGA
ncbi:MAG: ABC-2 family transporter protein [Bdellovibrionota bacterium]